MARNSATTAPAKRRSKPRAALGTTDARSKRHSDPNLRSFDAAASAASPYQLAHCSECPLNNRPRVPASGPFTAALALVGDRPGPDEVRLQVPFAGGAGRELDNVWPATLPHRDACWITNAIPCLPAWRHVEKDIEAARKCCQPRLAEELRRLPHLRVLITLGDAALKASGLTGSLLGDKDGHRGDNIPEHRLPGWPKDHPGVWTFPTVNPAFVLPSRQPAYRGILALDLQRAGRALQHGQLDWQEGTLLLEPTLADLAAVRARWTAAPPAKLSFDIETAGLGYDAPLTCIGVSDGELSVVVPLLTWEDGADQRKRYWSAPHEEKKARQFLQWCFDTFPLVAHNGQYDCGNLEFHGFRMAKRFAAYGVDTIGQAALVASELPKGLGTRCSFHLDTPRWKGMVDHGKVKRNRKWELNYRRYNALDVRNTYELERKQRTILECMTQQHPGLPALMQDFMCRQEITRRMTRRGFAVDQAEVHKQIDEHEPILHKAMYDFEMLTGIDNFEKKSAVRAWFYEEMGCEVVFRTEITQEPALTAEARQLFAQHPNEQVRAASHALDLCVSLAKKINTYIRRWAGVAEAHPTWNCHTVVSGRMSSDLFQTFPGYLRRMFKARDGHVIIEADYKQAEQRLLALVCDSKRLIATGQGDPHTNICKLLFDVTDEAWERMPKEDRSRKRGLSKTVWFACVQYLGGVDHVFQVITSKQDEKTGEYLYPNVKKGHIVAVLAQIDAVFPEIKQWIAWWKKLCLERGYAETLISGRPRLFLNGMDGEHERAVVNLPIQGTVADLTNRAMIDFDRYMPVDAQKPGIIGQIHDALLVECPRGKADRVARRLQECMEWTAQIRNMHGKLIDVRLPVDLKVMERWEK